MKLAFIFLTSIGFSFGAEFVAGLTGDWDVGASWGGTKPGTGDLARISGSGRNNSIATLDTAETVGRFIFGQGGTGGSLLITSTGSLTTSSTTDHRFGQTSAFDITLDGGSVFVPNATITSDAGASFTLNSGTFDVKGYTLGSATLTIDSASAMVDVENTTSLGAGSSTIFDFNNTTLVSAWNTGALNITTGAALTLNGLDTLVVGEYDLFTGTTTAPTNTFTTVLNGLDAGLIGNLVYDSDRVYLNVSSAPVPEPTSTALLGLGALGLLVRRKRA